jgi:CheY-like chemotaxis protein
MTGDTMGIDRIRHDLRTPLNAVIGYCEILLEDLAAGEVPGGDGLGRNLERIRRAAQQLLAQLDAIAGATSRGGPPPDWRVLGPQLRTPLTAIIGHSELLQEQLPIDRAADGGPGADLARIETAGRSLLALVGRLEQTAGDSGEPGPIPADHAGAAEPFGTATPPLPAGGPPRRAQATSRVLVVDDNEMNRDILSRRLRRLGYDVALADDGLQALEALSARPFDLVLLDVLMPGLDGYQVLERLKADPRVRHVPVIVLSALDDIEAAARCIEAGAEDYLPKPFNAVVLRARVGACLEKKRLHDQEALHLAEVEAERQRADRLLHVILPGEIVTELKTTDVVRPRRHEDVAVLFCDVAGFTSYCDNRPPEEVLANLQALVERYEEIALAHDLQKIKTIGDAFMAVAGLLKPVENPVLAAARCGLDMVTAAQELPGVSWNVRVGIHVGPVVAGVLGRRQYGYDLWGDTVNTAARVEHGGIVGAVTVSGEAWSRISGACIGESLGSVPAKGKGELDLYRVTSVPG